MPLAENIITKLAAAGAVSALVGARVFAVMAPPGTALPYVVFQVIASVPDQTHDSGAAGLDDTLVQFSCISSDLSGGYKSGRDLRRAVRTALDGAALADGEQVMIIGERDLYQPDLEAHTALLEVRCWRDALA